MTRQEKIDVCCLLIIGFGIGYLAGLSLSPVATILISGLLGVAIAIVGITSIFLVYRNDEGKVIPRVGLNAAETISKGQLALIVVGISAGVSFGIYARTHHFLGSDVSGLRQELNELQSRCDDKKWNELGINKKVLAQRIIDKHYPKEGRLKIFNSSSEIKNPTSFELNNTGGLTGSNISISDKCYRLLREDDLEKAIENSSMDLLKKMSSYVYDDKLREAIIIICKLLDNDKGDVQ